MSLDTFKAAAVKRAQGVLDANKKLIEIKHMQKNVELAKKGIDVVGALASMGASNYQANENLIKGKEVLGINRRTKP